MEIIYTSVLRDCVGGREAMVLNGDNGMAPISDMFV